MGLRGGEQESRGSAVSMQCRALGAPGLCVTRVTQTATSDTTASMCMCASVSMSMAHGALCVPPVCVCVLSSCGCMSPSPPHPPGPSMVLLWSLHGPSMVPSRSLHGPSMVPRPPQPRSPGDAEPGAPCRGSCRGFSADRPLRRAAGAAPCPALVLPPRRWCRRSRCRRSRCRRRV